MSALGRLFQGSKKADSRETLAKELLTKDNLATKTDIPKPLQMSIADTVAMWISDPATRNKMLKDANPSFVESNKLSDLKAGDILSYLLYWVRINRISYGRMSRGEFVKAITQTEFESDRTAKRLEKLFGMHTE